MTNQLYPAFFRLDRLQMLVVGAGAVGEEKLRFILKSSPNASVTIVAPEMGPELRSLLESYQREAYEQEVARSQVPTKLAERQQSGNKELPDIFQAEDPSQFDVDKLTKLGEIQLHDTFLVVDQESTLGGLYGTSAGGTVIYLKREFRPEDVEMADLVVAATDIKAVNLSVYDAAKRARRLCNIADTPDLCDFYLGSIVTRGPLKVAISTNGQSPTFAKRFRQFLEAELPDLESTNLLENLKVFRDRLTGDFQAKVRQLNAVTNSLLASANNETTACRCPDGECLVAAAAQKPAPLPSPLGNGPLAREGASAPAAAQEKNEE